MSSEPIRFRRRRLDSHSRIGPVHVSKHPCAGLCCSTVIVSALTTAGGLQQVSGDRRSPLSTEAEPALPHPTIGENVRDAPPPDGPRRLGRRGANNRHGAFARSRSIPRPTTNHGLRIPSLRRRVRRVLGLRPSIAAAPRWPSTTQRVYSSTVRIWSRSTSSSVS